ncbi:hypothetical protein [Acidovorax sp. 210-6]|uniref:hypothetical protein n=1 Tax=Acidovorax sp. 210-6 TaxID=2699468 RepID=UPI001389513D|nr:hypothetical protein [Acidovorax sp. 210-6]
MQKGGNVVGLVQARVIYKVMRLLDEAGGLLSLEVGVESDKVIVSQFYGDEVRISKRRLEGVDSETYPDRSAFAAAYGIDEFSESPFSPE